MKLMKKITLKEWQDFKDKFIMESVEKINNKYRKK